MLFTLKETSFRDRMVLSDGKKAFSICVYPQEEREGVPVLKIAICDDEDSYLHDVERLLDEYRNQRGLELLAVPFHQPFDLADQIEKNADFDLYLLDIYMLGMTGIALAQQLRNSGVGAPIIFLTTSKRAGAGCLWRWRRRVSCQAV